MKNKNRDDLLAHVLNALNQNDYLSYQEIVEDIENRQNISLECYDIPLSAIKSLILDNGMYADGEVPQRYKSDKPLFIANEKKNITSRVDKQIKWKKINY